MAKMFYSTEEACGKLTTDEDGLKKLVREGKLREFRDAGSIHYKVSDVDALLKAAPSKSEAAPPRKSEPVPAKSASGTAAGASATGEIVLEPVDDSSIELAPSTSDMMTLEGVDSAETTYATEPTKKAKEGSSVPSVGINVFEDEELDEQVDPLAQTAVSDVAGLGIEGLGSGSGILDLTRESDDTSLGAELLEEIYTGEESEEEKEGSAVAMGDKTRAGLDESLPEAAGEPAFEVEGVAGEAPGTARGGQTVVRVVEYAPDSVSSALTALVAVGLVVMGFAGLGAAALIRGTVPGLLQTVYDNLMYFAGGAVLAAGIASAVTYFLAKRSG